MSGKANTVRIKKAREDLKPTGEDPRRLVDHFFRHEYAKLVASLTNRFGVRYWELVEDVVQSSLQRALSSWSLSGVPRNPSAWLYRVAANLALDRLRRDARWNSLPDSVELPQDEPLADNAFFDEPVVQDEQLRMMFVCCDPEVPSESQTALALKTLCGFGHREIAKALFTTEASIAKRIMRAKRKLRDIGLEPAMLNESSLAERLPDVQRVIYLLFNEGYSSSLADRLIREELCEEAVRLAWMLAQHPRTEGPHTAALLALLLFHAARLNARMDADGAIILLKDQDRKLWDQELMGAAFSWFRRAAMGEDLNRYHAEAWIAGEHCRAPTFEDTDWRQIVLGYDILCKLAPSPVHDLNRAIALAHRDGPQAGLLAFAAIDSESLSNEYYLWHATHAELARQNGDIATAKKALHQAWELAPTHAEKQLIRRKLARLGETDE